jgi:hypothetical protein
MAFNTGNPVGSRSPKDLLDNSENLDELVNSPTKTEQDDRLGVPRKTWHGMETDFSSAQTTRQTEFVAEQAQREADFQQLLAESGYVGTGTGGAFEDYDADGPLTITAMNQIFTRSGEFYRAKPSTTLPFTTTGTWATDEASFVAVGDAALRSELASPDGGLLVKDGEATKDTIAEVTELVGVRNGQGFRVLTGEGAGQWRATTDDIKSEVDSDAYGYRYRAWDGGDGTTGGVVKELAIPVRPEEFSATGDGLTNEAAKLTAMESVGEDVYVSAGQNFLAKNWTGTLRFRGPGKVSGIPVEHSPFRARQFIKTPEAFGWNPPVSFWLNQDGTVGHEESWNDLFNVAGNNGSANHIYVDYAASGGTGTSGDPYGNMLTALQAISPGTDVVFHIQPGLYSRFKCWRYDNMTGTQQTNMGAQNVSFIVEDFQSREPSFNRAYFVQGVKGDEGAVFAWSSVGSGAYSSTLSGVVDYVIDAKGRMGRSVHDMPRLTKRASLAEVQANPGSFYHDTGSTTIYISTVDGRQPDTDVWVINNLDLYGANWPGGDYTCFIKDCSFVGRNCFTMDPTGGGGNGGVLATMDCEAGFNTLGSAFRAEDMYLTAHLRLKAGVCLDDAISYHANDAPSSGSYALEIDCIGYECGVGDGTPRNSNVSTAHDGMTVMRINTVGWRVNGPAIADANGCLSYCIGCQVSEPETESVDISYYNFYGTGGTQDAQAWLVQCGCVPNGENSSINLGDASDVTNVFNFSGNLGVRGNGTAQAYELEYWPGAPVYDPL